MNISTNNMNSYISQLSQVNSGYSNTALSRAFQNQEPKGDEMSISSEGKAMSKMMRRQESKEAMEAHKTAFQETYAELDIESLDVENMTDEEITEVLSAFESSMSEYMHEGFKPASDMESSELKEALTNIQGMNDRMSGAKGQYGPPPGGKGGMKGMKGPKPAGMDMMQSIESEDEEEEDLISTLLEALDAQEDDNNLFASKNMNEILELISQSGSNI